VGRGIDRPDAFITITVSLVAPRSRGEVRLQSADPLVVGARLARSLGHSPAYDGLRGDEIEPGPAATSDADLVGFARLKADTIYHAAGTCRMGPASDPDAVVDAQLRVHGLDGLRVTDASIMPEAVNAPTHAACVAIGEKYASLVAGTQVDVFR